MKLRLPLPALLLVFPLFLVQGCSSAGKIFGTNDIDPAGGLSRDDYLALRQRGTPPDASSDSAAAAPSVPANPETEPAAPEKTPPSPLDKRVNLTVTDSVPVRDVLMELVRKTGANLELDPRVQGSVILSARDQPFGQVLKRICALAGLRYTADGAFIRIEPDDPYQKSYRLDYPRRPEYRARDARLRRFDRQAALPFPAAGIRERGDQG